MSPYPVAVGPAERYQDSHLLVDFQTEAVYLDGARLKMPRKEFDLLSCLLRHAGELVSRETLFTTVWSYSSGVRTRTLDVHIRRLRKSLDPYGKFYIETVFSVGYRFQRCPQPAAGPSASFVPPQDRSGSGAWRWSQSTQ